MKVQKIPPQLKSPENHSKNQQNFCTYGQNYNTSNAEYQYDNNYLAQDFYKNHEKNPINSVCANEGYESKKN